MEGSEKALVVVIGAPSANRLHSEVEAGELTFIAPIGRIPARQHPGERADADASAQSRAAAAENEGDHRETPDD